MVMHINRQEVRNYDLYLFVITVVAVSIFAFVALSVVPERTTNSRISQLAFISDPEERLTFETVLDNTADNSPALWTPTVSPVNLGMSSDVHWFSFVVTPDSSRAVSYLFEIDYALLDSVEVAVYPPSSSSAIVRYQAGDNLAFDVRPIANNTPLFSLPLSAKPQTVVVRVESSGTIRMPIAVWEEREFIEYAASQNLALGLFFGFLCAMAISNIFLFLLPKIARFYSIPATH